VRPVSIATRRAAKRISLILADQKLGDGLMALFGYPLAHENDAERAARAALSIQRASPTFTARMPLPASQWRTNLSKEVACSAGTFRRNCRPSSSSSAAPIWTG
jgi:hypothetical protein